MNDRPRIALILHSAAGGGLAQAPEEAGEIEKIFSTIAGWEAILLSYVNIHDLIDEIEDRRQEIEIIHYAGHASPTGLFFAKRGGQGDYLLPSSFFAKQVKELANLRLVFVNGCQSDHHAPDLTEASVPVVLTATRRIDDDKAQFFANEFYKALARGMSIEDAAKSALNRTHAKSHEGRARLEASLAGPADIDDIGKRHLSDWRLHGSRENRAWTLFADRRRESEGYKATPNLSKRLGESLNGMSNGAFENLWSTLDLPNELQGEFLSNRVRRARRLLSWFTANTHLDVLEQLIDECECRDKTRWWQRCRWSSGSGAQERERLIRGYLEELAKELEAQNRTKKNVRTIALRAEYRGRAFRLTTPSVRKITGKVRSGGGECANELALKYDTQIVKNAVRELRKGRWPVVLLGEPGSGKSVTIRQVGIDYVNRQIAAKRPKVPVYIPLGYYIQCDEKGGGD